MATPQTLERHREICGSVIQLPIVIASLQGDHHADILEHGLIGLGEKWSALNLWGDLYGEQLTEGGREWLNRSTLVRTGVIL